MMVGGTPTNVCTIASALRPYEAVVAPRSAHIYAHECGAVEKTGHKIIPRDPVDGKITPELIDKAWIEYEDDHTVLPRLLSISQTTELGSLYSLAELKALRAKCDEKDMLLYIDGARLGVALTAPDADNQGHRRNCRCVLHRRYQTWTTPRRSSCFVERRFQTLL